MTAGSKAEQPLAKAKPISNCGSTPGETDLREGKKILCIHTWRQDLEYVIETTLQTPKIGKKEEVELFQCARAKIPLQALVESMVQSMVKSMVRQLFPAAHGGPWWSRDSPAAPGEPHSRAGGCPTEVVTLQKAHAEQAPGWTCGPRERSTRGTAEEEGNRMPSAGTSHPSRVNSLQLLKRPE
ncbi:hypothetical protein HGM15179_013163 [Zosterops borbonicus]|uniref:Uncharacterized protein n=1 Tax=Zosterops borbonicus TaxID=364589 RepID=A0A8K1G985_9PASS|nr:hypothetical protein HGM15179_013163 [Zosterops borbonicus]